MTLLSLVWVRVFRILIIFSDAAENEENYEDLTQLTTFSGNSSEEVFGYTEPKPRRKGVERGKIFWQTDMPNVYGRQRACDVIDLGRKRDRFPGQAYGSGKKIEHIIDCFNLLYTPSMYELRVQNTNEKIQKIMENITLSYSEAQDSPDNRSYRQVYPTDARG